MFKRSIVLCGLICLLWCGNVYGQGHSDKAIQELNNSKIASTLVKGVDGKYTMREFVEGVAWVIKNKFKASKVYIFDPNTERVPNSVDIFVYYGQGGGAGMGFHMFSVVATWREGKKEVGTLLKFDLDDSGPGLLFILSDLEVFGDIYYSIEDKRNLVKLFFEGAQKVSKK